MNGKFATILILIIKKHSLMQAQKRQTMNRTVCALCGSLFGVFGLA
jgi:hypothetical protein